MMLAEIGIPPGAEVDRSTLQTAKEDWAISQYDVLPDRVLVYLWPRANGVSFNFQFRPRFGLRAKSAASILYDYYNPDSVVVLPPSLFTVRWQLWFPSPRYLHADLLRRLQDLFDCI